MILAEPEVTPLPSSGYVLIMNANPITGVPTVVGEAAERADALEESASSSSPVGTIPFGYYEEGPPHLSELMANLALRKKPTVVVARFTPSGLDILREGCLELSPQAALRFFHCLWKEGKLDDEEFLRSVPPETLSIERPYLDLTRNGHLVPLTRGTPIHGDPTMGYLIPADVLRSNFCPIDQEMGARREYANGDSQRRCGPYVVVVDRVDARHTVLLADERCRGMLALRGSRADHFALLARERQFPYMVLEGHQLDPDGLRVGKQVVPFGTLITVDFPSGQIYSGEGELAVRDRGPDVRTVRQLLATRRITIRLRVNVDASEDFGGQFPHDACGIGLLRTEHVILRSNCEGLLHRALVNDGVQVEPTVREELRRLFEREFARLLELVDGRPVAIRLLDFPLHELRDVSPEVNPMLGLRGVRQGLQWPHVYRSQIEALLAAGVKVRRAGLNVGPLEITVPLVTLPGEVEVVSDWVYQARHDVPASEGLVVRVGAMVETPSALAVVESLARRCDFLSFGTNDLTQLVFGLSREDYLPVLRAYRRYDLLIADPFETLHPLLSAQVSNAAQRARRANPRVTIGLCGAHAGDSSTLDLCLQGVLDYVSVPVEQLCQTKLRALAINTRGA